MSSEGKVIVNNLKDRVHSVNLSTAIHGIADVTAAMTTLDLLITENIVIREFQTLPDGTSAPLYRYNRFRIGLKSKSNIRPVPQVFFKNKIKPAS